MKHAVNLVTKGILGGGIPLVTKGVIWIVETPLRRRKGVGVQGFEKPKKRVSVYFGYNDVVYEHKVIVNSDMKINVNDIEIYTEQGTDIPKIRFKVDD